jgi:enediyne biosynthesis protein E8
MPDLMKPSDEGENAVPSAAEDGDQFRTMTLEAYADTILPGEKRWPGDRAIAGVSEGGGAVTAGAVAVLETPEGGMAPALDDVVAALNAHAERYRGEHDLPVDESVAPFVALESPDRIGLITELTAPGHPEKELWTGLALFCYMAYDTAAHMHTTDALKEGHPGLISMGFAKPDDDGLWRFPDSSYRRQLSNLHPDTTPTGSPA